MALIRNVEPGVRELAVYIVARSRERRITLNRTRLVKLLYLVDVESIRARTAAVTGLEWAFLDHGPSAVELLSTLDELERNSALYRATPEDAPDGDDWLSATRRTVDSVVERFALLPTNELLDHVYFHTAPMAGALRGRPLDMRRAGDDPSPRRLLALHPPARPGDVDQRLSRWRTQTAARLAPLSLDPPAAMLEDRADELEFSGVRGRLHVPDALEL